MYERDERPKATAAETGVSRRWARSPVCPGRTLTHAKRAQRKLFAPASPAPRSPVSGDTARALWSTGEGPGRGGEIMPDSDDRIDLYVSHFDYEMEMECPFMPDTEEEWYAANSCTHAHCPWACDHPQPFISGGKLFCGRCWFVEGVAVEMVPCGEGCKVA